jgi:ABC-type polar amino acid transport system ATPase subunit
MLGISELLARYPSQLSGGQQQRVAIARALTRTLLARRAAEQSGRTDTRKDPQRTQTAFNLQIQLQDEEVTYTIQQANTPYIDSSDADFDNDGEPPIALPIQGSD